MRTNFRLVLLLSAVAIGCTGKANDSAIGVTVTLPAQSPITCVRVEITPSSGTPQLSDGIAVNDRTELHVAIFRGGELTGDVSLLARGFVGKGCEDSARAYEDSEPASASFVDAQVTQVTLALSGQVSGDEDDDGYRSVQAGGDDCDDSNRDVHPGVEELCDNGRDDDCAAGADCVDPTCSGKSCSDGDPCTSGETCGNSLCEGGVEMTCNQPPGECYSQTGSCTEGACAYPVTTSAPCSQGFCRSDGTCAPPGVETQCTNGKDDDQDGLADCLDSDCNGQSCDDGNVCTQADVCNAGACASVPVQCSSPPNGCFDSTGACGQDGGCGYTQHAAGSSCGSGMDCGVDGGCNAQETGSLCTDGVDNDQDGTTDCADPSCNGVSCNDSNACTASDKCASGQCGGSQVTCTPAMCMQANGACNPASGCSYSVTNGAACPGGTCAADAGCTLFFGYPASNFDRTTVASPNVNAVINCNTPTINTNDNSITGWCSGVSQPKAMAITLANGEAAAGYVFDWLQVGTGGAIRFIGQKPAILIVLGNATIDGTLDVSGDHDASRGAGGSYPPALFGGPEAHCGNGTGGNGSTASGTTGGGGGGAFGGAGGTGGAGSSGGNGGSAGQLVTGANLVPLRGGCAGGNGGQTSTDYGGIGGGALQISAAGVLSISGKISAAGGGGRGGSYAQAGGAGGGGSGGAILLEGESVSIASTALITANGGAGGEGQGNNTGTGGSQFDGADGTNGNDNSANVTPGADGSGTIRGGPGGAGAAGATATGGNATAGNSGTGNGGGGGGGVGKIRVNSHTTCSLTAGRVISPPPTSNKAGTGGCP